MKKVKNHLAVLLVLALVLCLMPATAFALDENETEIISVPCVTKVTPTTISVKAMDNVQYRLGSTGTWTSEAVFSGLYPNTNYTVYYRYGTGDATSLGVTKTTAVTAPASQQYIDSEAPYQLSMTGYLTTFDLQNDLSFFLYLSASKYSANYSDLRLYVMHKTYSGNSFSGWKTSIVTASPNLVTYNNTSCYAFCLKGMAAAELMDDLCITLYAKETSTGHTFITPVYATTMEASARNLLSKATSSSQKTLIVDFLNYAAATQTYFSYNTNNLANSNISSYSNLATQNNPTLVTTNAKVNTLPNATASFSGTTFSLDSKIGLRMAVNITETDTSNITLKISYTPAKTSLGTQNQTYALKGNKTDGYYFLIDNIAAADFGSAFEMTVYKGTTPISDTRLYSVESRVKSMLEAGSTNQNYINLLWAMMKYSRSARAFFS